MDASLFQVTRDAATLGVGIHDPHRRGSNATSLGFMPEAVTQNFSVHGGDAISAFAVLPFSPTNIT